MEQLLEILAQERIHGQLEDDIRRSSVHKATEKRERRYWEYVLKVGLSQEQRNVIDQLMDFQNYFSAEYGQLAYKRGLQDGIALMKEIQAI